MSECVIPVIEDGDESFSPSAPNATLRTEALGRASDAPARDPGPARAAGAMSTGKRFSGHVEMDGGVLWTHHTS